MMAFAKFAHIATAKVGVSASLAFAFLSDPIALGRWSLGCFETSATKFPGIYTGHSLYDGAQGWFKIVPDSGTLSIEYQVGTPESLFPYILAKVIPGGSLMEPDETCTVSLIAWRTSQMNDRRWHRLCAAHEVEIDLIKEQLEMRYRA